MSLFDHQSISGESALSGTEAGLSTNVTDPPLHHYLEFRHVYKTFDRPILVDVSFHVDNGETVAIIGRSGVGKSVSLQTIMGFLKPDQGQVIVGYRDVTDYTESEWREVRKKVTMVFQSGALFDSLTIGENILFSLELREDYDDTNKMDVVRGLLRMVDLEESIDMYPADISTGYKRAVAIARALAAQPACILYDEPTTMVDPIMSSHLSALMVRLKTQLKLTSIVVTHDLDLMNQVADRVVFLHDGRAIFSGPVKDLYQFDHPHVQEFLHLDEVSMDLTKYVSADR
ncbi:MAG: ATP-binding cassette domain-containing protein [Bryobacterales bacterium]|nr:ATP-binding cassette domain-containing protein [Bryobacterales bacterium]